MTWNRRLGTPLKRNASLAIETITLVVVGGLIIGLLLWVRSSMTGYSKTTFVETSWLGLAAIPLVIWLVVSGRLKELTVGGVSAKLTDEQEKPVQPSTGKGTAVPMQTLAAGAPPQLHLQQAAPESPAFVELQLGTSYTQEQLAELKNTISQSLLVPALRYIAFTAPQTHKLKAYVPAAAMLTALSAQDGGESAMQAIKSGDVDAIPGTRDDKVTQGVTKSRTALAIMAEHGRDDVAVVDGDGRLAGLLERSAIVDRFVSAMAGS